MGDPGNAVLGSHDLLAAILHHVQPPSLRPLLRRDVAPVAVLWRAIVNMLVADWAALSLRSCFTIHLPVGYIIPAGSALDETKRTASPFKAAALPNGETLIISDDAAGFVKEYDANGRCIRDLSPLPPTPGLGQTSLAICASNDHLFVYCLTAGLSKGKLVRLRLSDGVIIDEAGNDEFLSFDDLLASIHQESPSNPNLGNPCACVHAEGVLYVADTHHDRVVLFDTDPFLDFRSSFGSRGEGPGQFQNPNGVAIFGDECFVSDRRNRRIQVFTTDGSFVRAFPTPARNRGGRRGPKALAIDSSGRLLVVEADTVAVLTRTGELLQLLPIAGSERLTGIALSATTTAFVTECEQGKVHVLDLLSS